MSIDALIQVLGFLAPVLFLFAYAMVSLGNWQSTMLRYHLFNLLGALCILVSLTRQWNLAVFLLEICWGAISLYGIGKCVTARAKSRT